MLKDRKELEKYLIKYVSNTSDTKVRQHWYTELEERYNIPISMSSDILTMRKDFSEYNEFVLYAITDVVKQEQISKYYAEREIQSYSTTKYKIKKVGFPIKLKMLQVDDDQFIGVTSAKFLMKLREAQLINYNADTQRALEIMINDGREIFRPYVSSVNVNEIKELYGNKGFIPNTISLNISLDDDKADYNYDEESCTLKINNLTAFDIFDGYHRYLAMAANYDADNSFDYPMELRITIFSVERAKQFIWQEDHKTKMKKVDAATFDQYNPGNIVINKLDSDAMFNLQNNIGLQDKLIHGGVMSEIINKLYFTKKPDRRQIISVTRELKDELNLFTETYEEYLERKWKKHEILITIFGIYNGYTSEVIYTAINSITKEQIKYINKSTIINKKILDLLQEVYNHD